MRTIAPAKFLRWAAGKDLRLDPEYPDSAVLDFQGGSDSRFWVVPPEPERRPYFVASLLELMGEWQICYVWRHLGSWPAQASVDGGRINDAVELRILKGLGMPLGTADIVLFDVNDFDTLATLLFSTTIFGWSVNEDLYVVPDHAQQVLQSDHHGVIHVSFRAPADIAHWVSEMSQRGFDLPDELPDATFKRPSWMPE